MLDRLYMSIKYDKYTIYVRARTYMCYNIHIALYTLDVHGAHIALYVRLGKLNICASMLC